MHSNNKLDIIESRLLIVTFKTHPYSWLNPIYPLARTLSFPQNRPLINKLWNFSVTLILSVYSQALIPKNLFTPSTASYIVLNGI